MTEIPYIDRLRDDLLAGITQRQRKITRRRRTAMIGAPIALAAAVAVATVPGGTSPALAINDEGDWIELRIDDIAASESQMEREMRDLAIDADIRLVPVTDGLVGQWACIAEVADGDPAGEDPDGAGPRGRSYEVRLQEVRYTPDKIRIRRDFAAGTQDGQLVFVAGRRPETGEQASADPCRDLFSPR